MQSRDELLDEIAYAEECRMVAGSRVWAEIKRLRSSFAQALLRGTETGGDDLAAYRTAYDTMNIVLGVVQNGIEAGKQAQEAIAEEEGC
jgi:hypothetical protein